MSTKAKLYLFDREFTILYFTSGMYTPTDYRGKPWGTPNGGLISVVIPCPQKPSEFLDAMLHDQMVSGKIQFWKWDGIHVDAALEFANAHIVNRETVFYSDRARYNYTMRVVISPGIQRYRGTTFEKSWNPSNPFVESTAPVLTRESLQPQITRIAWVNADEQQEDITEIGSNQNASLVAEINNPQGTTVTVTIEKEDGTEFEKGKKQLSFTETISDDGQVEISPFEIKEAWEAYKTADVDKLIAKVAHNGVSKKSAALKLIPKPKATLHFRPHSGWSGEFGFDWMRIEDTSIDGDVDYEQNVGEYGTVYATKPTAVFTPKDYNLLEDEYNPTHINNRTDAAGNPIQYYTPSLTIYRAPNVTTPPYAELELLTEVDVAPDELYIEFPKKYFDIAGAVDDPNDINIRHYKLATAMKGVTTAGNLNKTNIQLQCIHTLAKDETIKVWAARKKADGTLDTPILSGMLTVKANNKINRRISKIVFVNVKTNINGNSPSGLDGINATDKITQENYLTPFLKQALVKPEVENQDLDLYDTTLPAVQTLNTDYTLPRGNNKIFNKYRNGGGISLVEFLTQQFNAIPSNTKYANYFKVFFLAEPGARISRMRIVGLGGHANGIPSKECVMYANPMPFFVAHELMHCMGLYHSFDNKGKHTFKIGQTENIMDYSHVTTYATPNGTLTQISTWQWQWDILKNSNENET